MKPMNERLAWLAGIIDGEGFVSVTASQTVRFRKYQQGIVERALRWQIRIGNTNESLINEVCSILDSLGIGYFVSQFETRNPNHKPCHFVAVHGRKRVEPFLRAVMPWLISKKPQAELLLRMGQRRDTLKYHSVPLDDSILREQLLELRKLNRRGRNSDFNLQLPMALRECSQRTTSAKSTSGERGRGLLRETISPPEKEPLPDERSSCKFLHDDV